MNFLGKKINIWVLAFVIVLVSGILWGAFLTRRQPCTIKGNINEEGEKIYHVVGQMYYNRTKIDESMGERWFCNENDATLNGWRKSRI